MRVLVVDQDSANNEAIARSLRDLYTVDAVTNKGDCLDLLRSNTFEVIVAAERLEDGSGLELLGQIARKWPSVLRIFAADRQRLQLLKGRLGPFELFQALTYPIDPDRLIAALNLAEAAQDANADTSNIQHVVLSAEPVAEEADAPEEGQAPESEESEDLPAPRPEPRAAPAESAQAASRGTRAAAHSVPVHRGRSTVGQRPRRNGAAGLPTTRASSGPSAARGAAPSPSLSPEGGRSSRHGRFRGATKPPVRFPPLERVPPLERIPPLEPPGSRPRADSFSEAAAMARAARSNYEPAPEGIDTKRLTLMIGGGAAVVLAVIVLGFKMFGSKSDAPKAVAPQAAHAPEYPQAVTDLVAQTEAAFKGDDFKSARADVEKLRQISPSHPRLPFFEGLLAQRADGSKGIATSASAGRNASKRNGQSSRRSGSGATPDYSSVTASTRAPTSPTTASPAGSTSPASSTSPAGTPSPTVSAGPDSSASQSEPTLAPETPAGFSRASAASVAGATPSGAMTATVAASATSATPSATTTRSATGAAPAEATTGSAASGRPAAVTTAADDQAASRAPSASTSTQRASSGEPPPVVREAKLTRRVNPDYPSAAKRDGIEGTVDLEVTVSARGVVQDVSVIRATPPDMFEKSALAAVRKWKYDPRYVDGLPTVARVNVHLEFGPNK